jgi:hypothetical protein
MIEWSQKVKRELEQATITDAYVFMLAVVTAGVIVHAVVSWVVLQLGAP